MDVSKIKDEDSLRAWLEGRSREDAMAIAVRAALRVFPLFAQQMAGDWARSRDLTTLPVLRTLLTASVSGKFALRLSGVSTSATYAQYRSLISVSTSASSAAAAAAAASGAAATAAANSAESAAVAAAPANSDAAKARATIWQLISYDAMMLESREDLFAQPLWYGDPPNWFLSAEALTQRLWLINPKTWDFWVRWWDGVVVGKPLDWELQKQVALIPESDWKKGPDQIAALIRDIEARNYLDQVIRDNPYAWRIELNHRTGIYSAVAIEKRDLSAVISDVRSAINDFHVRCKKLSVGNFGQAAQLAFKPVIDMLRRDLRRYSDQPLALFKAIEAAKTEMQTIADVEGLAGESYISRFFATLEGNAEDICIVSPDIVEQLKAKSALRYDLWDAERKRAMAVQTLALHLDAEGILKRASFLALATIQNPNSTDDERKEAWYFMTANLPRAARAYLADKAEHGEASVRSKESMATRIVEGADALSKLDKGKDAILEVYSQIPDGLELARSIVENLQKF